MAYLQPVTPPTEAAYDNDLEDVFQAHVVGILGVDPTLVRPRWQPTPPNMPDFTADWVAIGITQLNQDKFAYKRTNAAAGSDPGSVDVERDEFIQVMLSFYGPNSSRQARRYIDGVQIDINRAALFIAQAIKFQYVDEAIAVPALVKETWVKRLDVKTYFSRRVSHRYAVPNIIGGGIGLDNEQYLTNINEPH